MGVIYVADSRLPDGFLIGVCLGFHGLKSPRLFNFASFRRHLYTDIIKTGGLKAPGDSCSRLPDAFLIILISEGGGV